MLTDRAALEAHIKANPVEGDPAQMRAAFDRLACAPSQVPIRAIGGIACGVFGKGAPVVWLHGGGYVFGNPRSHANCAQRLADLSGFEIIVPDYRLAPENPWPAALEDTQAVLKAVGKDVPLIGDSAGGHLALNICLQTEFRPAAVALISPNTDRTGRSATRAANGERDLMNDDSTDAELAEMTFGHRAAEQPDVSPILADLTRLPRVYLTAARNEVLAGDSFILHGLARAAGVEMTFDEQDDLFHMWHLWPDATPQAQRTLSRIADFLRNADARP